MKIKCNYCSRFFDKRDAKELDFVIYNTYEVAIDYKYLICKRCQKELDL